METRIDATAKLTGTLSTEDDLVLEGVLEGSLQSTASVTLVPGSRVKGDITGREIRVAGTVEGNVLASALFVLQSGGKILGDVRAAHIQVEDGGVLSGKVITETPAGFAPKAKG